MMFIYDWFQTACSFKDKSNAAQLNQHSEGSLSLNENVEGHTDNIVTDIIFLLLSFHMYLLLLENDLFNVLKVNFWFRFREGGGLVKPWKYQQCLLLIIIYPSSLAKLHHRDFITKLGSGSDPRLWCKSPPPCGLCVDRTTALPLFEWMLRRLVSVCPG